jgi:two-component system chemotaxis sensor kinase CheA
VSVGEDEEILLAFCEESRENLDQMDRDLVDLEARGADKELLSRVFRTVHTLKGTCGFLGFTRLESVAHAGEDLLSALRDETLVLDAASATTLLRLVDAARTSLAQIESDGHEPPGEHLQLVVDLRSFLQLDGQPPGQPTGQPTGQSTGQPLSPPPPPTAAELRAPSSPEGSVRVDVAVLDRLMDLVGELVLARSRIGELAAIEGEGPLSASYRDLRVVAGDLQDSVMAARLQPVGTVTGKFPRIARDLATALGKQVVVRIEGESVGVDKAVNEALRDPLLHLVRNCLDHGIETPVDRLAAGKPAAGLLSIRACHEGGRVHVEVSDDGRGVDLAALSAKAVAQGVVSADDAQELTQAQVLDLMFHPGLSTREEVSSTSGRGVGMDVVRASVEQVGGSVEVTSTRGSGTMFEMNVPLTLAIMPVLVTACGGSRYAIPQVHLLEVLQLSPDQLATRVDVVGHARLLRLRGRLLPLVDLGERLAVTAARTDGLVVVVVETDARRFGLVVDEVADTVDAVVKPLPALLRPIPVFAGTTILGDGRPALVVDVEGLAAAAGITSVSIPLTGGAGAGGSGSPLVDPLLLSLLLATAQDGGLVAVPVRQVRRLERFAVGRVERSGDTTVVQYGDELLPMLWISEILPERRKEHRGPQPVLTPTVLETAVCETRVGPVGFVVASIDDVVPEPPAVRQPAGRPGVQASVVVDGRVVELLDVDALAERAGIGRCHDLERRVG